MKPMFNRKLGVQSLSDILYICEYNPNVSACIVFGRQEECANAVKEFYSTHIEGVCKKECPKFSSYINLWFNSGSVLRVIPGDMLTTISHFNYCLFSETINEETYRMITSKLIAYERQEDPNELPSQELMEFISSFRVNKSGGVNGD